MRREVLEAICWWCIRRGRRGQLVLLERAVLTAGAIVPVGRQAPNPERVLDYLQALQLQDVVWVKVAKTSGRVRWGLKRDLGPQVPTVKRGELVDPNQREFELSHCQKVWNAARMKGAFSGPELEVPTNVAGNWVRRWLRRMHGAGYLRREVAASMKGPARYRLVRNTGPVAPLLVGEGAAWDGNLGKWFH